MNTTDTRSPLDILLAGGPDMTVPYVPSAEEVAAPVSKEEARRLLSIKENDENIARMCARYKARPRTNWRDRG